MNLKEIAEIKRRFRPDKHNISRLCGCLVNEKKEILSVFEQSLALMPQEECDAVLSLLRKVLSGSKERNLIDISFTNAQVLDSEEHRLLSTLRTSELGDKEACSRLYDLVREGYESEGNYLILLCFNAYDVPSFKSDGERKEDSFTQYSFVTCAICPLKMTRATLGYRFTEGKLQNNTPNWEVAAPTVGFLFPAFDGRTSNIYNALFYKKDLAASHANLIEALFHREAPMPPVAQKETFHTILRDTLEEACSIEVVKSMREELGTMVEEHKATKDPDPLFVSKETVSAVLRQCGIEEARVERFESRFDEAFGAKTEMPPANMIEMKQLQVKTPEVSIRIASDAEDVLETRILDGKKCIVIRADGIVEVNGMEISITD